MSRDANITITTDIRRAVAAIKRLQQAIQNIERHVKRIGSGPRPGCGWRHRKGQARR